MTRMRNLTNMRFGRLTVICFSHIGKNGKSNWFCTCECGEEKIVSQSSLKSGRTKSCGCLWKESIKNHGLWGVPEYICWDNMRSRCHNKNNPQFKNYGGRGITVCDRWKNSFENFYEDMGEKPEPKELYSLERINNDGNYKPKNCKWATLSEQRRNQRVRGKVPLYGVGKSPNGTRFTARIYINSKNVQLGTFDTSEEAAKAYDDAYEQYYGVRKNKTERDS